jgi:NAD(P)-dependent dehydrogenase (short-subunit alcohol dehydrogenase family)
MAECHEDEVGGSVSSGVLIVGGTGGIGLEIARAYAGRGSEVVVSSRDRSRAESVAAEIGAPTRGIALDLSAPRDLARQLAEVAAVDRLVLAAISRDVNTVRDYDIALAVDLVTVKLVGYTEVVHVLADRMHDETAILLFGGMAKDRPYAGSTTVSSVNGAVTAMVRTFALELAPVRVNAIHPGIVADSPFWAGNETTLEATLARTPTRRLPTMADVVDASVFLLENRSVNGVNLNVDGGWIMS